MATYFWLRRSVICYRFPSTPDIEDNSAKLLRVLGFISRSVAGILTKHRVTEWPLFWKELPTLLTIRSLYILTICYSSYFPFWFEGGIWVLIAQVPGHCILLFITLCIFYLV